MRAQEFLKNIWLKIHVHYIRDSKDFKKNIKALQHRWTPGPTACLKMLY